MELQEATTEQIITELIKRNGTIDAPRETKYFTSHKEVLLEIGKDETAHLILDKEAVDEVCKIAKRQGQG